MIRKYLYLNRDAELELNIQTTQQERANEATATHTVDEIETKVLDQVAFLTLSWEETDDSRDDVQKLEGTLRDGPTNQTPKLSQFGQNSASRFAVSIGDNSFGRTSIAFNESTKDKNSD